MYRRNITTYLLKELDFLKLLISRFHEQEKTADLEFDVALSKTQEIYEQLLKLKLVSDVGLMEGNEVVSLPKDINVFSKDIVEKTVVEVELQTLHQPECPAPAISEIKVSDPVKEEIIITESVILEKEAIAPEDKKQSAKLVSEPIKTTTGILAEKISPSDLRPINETLAQQKTLTDLSSKWQTAPLTSIATGIGLNERFLYIRELFKGDNALYGNAIRHLDDADSLDDALGFIQRHFSWDEENETAQKFIHLVHRRHAK